MQKTIRESLVIFLAYLSKVDLAGCAKNISKIKILNCIALFVVHPRYSSILDKGPLISEDICSIFQLPKKYSVFLPLACWRLSFEFWRTFLESVSKSWGFQLSPRGLNSDFQWIWQMICLICWWNYQKCTHFVVIHNNTFSNFKFRIVQGRNLEYFLGDIKNDSHFLKKSHL